MTVKLHRPGSQIGGKSRPNPLPVAWFNTIVQQNRVTRGERSALSALTQTSPFGSLISLGMVSFEV